MSRGYQIFVGGHYKDCIPLNAADQWLILFPIMGDFCTKQKLWGKVFIMANRGTQNEKSKYGMLTLFDQNKKKIGIFTKFWQQLFG